MFVANIFIKFLIIIIIVIIIKETGAYYF